MKKIYIVISTLLVLSLLWYLFLKPYDYVVSFTANTFPGTINQTIKKWNQQMVSAKPITQKTLLELSQQLKFGDSILIYDWEIIPNTDSTSRVKVRIKDLDNSLMNKIKIPFTKTILEQRSKENLIGFTKILNSHIKNFRVRISGMDELETVYCAYIPIKSTQEKKAFGMMSNYPYLTGFIKDNNLQENGIPFVEITHWDMKNDSVAYNFCYPIKKSDSLPEHKEIKFKEIKKRKTLKAIYNGNYITSDRAWYKLLDYALKNDIRVDSNPIEFFYDNPNLGGEEIKWKAEIHMPIISNTD